MHQRFLSDMANQGWHRLAANAALLNWSQAHLPAAQACMQATQNLQWWRYQDTWFAGVNALDNDKLGAVANNPSLPKSLLTSLANYCESPIKPLDQGQISAIFPSYPQIDPQQSTAANRFRQEHFAAHLDGLVPLGTQRRRHLTEQHSFILGISLTEHPPAAAPIMVWPGSHQRIQQWLINTLEGMPPNQWQEVDLTYAYQTLRHQILHDTQPQALHLAKGEAYVLHRHIIHGMGHWPEDLEDGHQQGRIIAYFRPCWHSPQKWLSGA